MRLRVCVSCLIWPDAVFRDHLHGHNSPPPQSWKSDLIDIITRLTYSVVSREAQDNCTRSIDFSLCCYTNALKRRKEGGGHFTMGPYCRSFRWWWSRSVVQYVVDTPFFLSADAQRLTEHTSSSNIPPLDRFVSRSSRPLFFERDRHFFCRGRRFGCD